MSDYRVFVVPYDFSEHARAALYAAADLARRLGADLHLVHVVQAPYFAYARGPHTGAGLPSPDTTLPSRIDVGELREIAMSSLRDVAQGIADLPGKLEPHVVEATNIAAAIGKLAEELSADLIVMGTHGRTGLAHAFLGSVAERTLRRAPCPVLTVQAPEDESTR